MINNENLENMYKLIVSEKELTTKELYNCGFSQNDLTKLVENGILERVKRGQYKLLNLSGLNDYAKKYIFTNNDLAIKIFEKSYMIDSKNSFTILNLFKSAIVNFEQEKILEYLNVISNLSKNNYAKSDYNLYIFLLQYLMPLPEYYKNQVELLTNDDFKIDEKDIRNNSNINENKIRLAIFNRNFDKAYKLNKAKKKQKNKMCIQDLIISEILLQIFEKENAYKELLNAYITKKEFKKIIELIKIREQQHKLSTRDEIILKITYDILKIKESNKYIVPEIFQTKYIEQAIFGRNYKLALELKTKKMLNNNKVLKNDLVYLLLYEINNLLDNLKITEEDLKEKYFNKINKFIINGERSSAKNVLKEYLKITDNKKYERLLMLYFELLELNLKYQDVVLEIISLINSNSYQYNVATIIGNYYLSLFNKKMNEAKIFLEILKNCENLSNENYNIKDFEDVLYFLENQSVEKDEIKIKEEVNNEPENIEEKDVQKQRSILANKTTPRRTLEPSIHEKEFIKNKRLEILETNEVILLKKMDNNRYKNIEKILEEIPDITYYYAGRGDNKRMLLKYSSEKLDILNQDEYFEKYQEAYDKEDYETALYYLKELLNAGYNTLSIFYKIGIIYFKTYQFDLASTYLTIANLMNKEIGGKYDITDFVIFVDDLKTRKQCMRNHKPRFTMTLDEFEYDYDEYYGINNFEDINAYIIENNLDVETGCLQLGLSYEKIDLIKLIYAKLYYYQGNFVLGDKFLKSVESTKDKTIYVRNIQKIIKSSRDYYVHRNIEKDISFIRKLKPSNR